MPRSSPEINRKLRNFVTPVLKELGFDRIVGRSAWRNLPYCVWVVRIKAVGAYFSAVTGWPPSSICIEIGAYYTFLPAKKDVKIGPNGNPLPKEHECHIRKSLLCHIDQGDKTAYLPNPAERVRKDIWWLHQDGSNALEVAIDIAYQLKTIGVPWLEELTNLQTAIVQIEATKDCFDKYYLAQGIAKKLGNLDAEKTYEHLLIEERAQHGVNLDQTICLTVYE